VNNISDLLLLRKDEVELYDGARLDGYMKLTNRCGSWGVPYVRISDVDRHSL
jgi:hypothetical protein